MNLPFRKVVAPVFLMAITKSVWSVAVAQGDSAALDMTKNNHGDGADSSLYFVKK
jgi:hypothetical protein